MFGLFDYANAYIRWCDWKDISLLKLCLLALGVLLGLVLPKKARKPAACVAVVVFVLTYVPAMARFLRGGSRKNLRS